MTKAQRLAESVNADSPSDAMAFLDRVSELQDNAHMALVPGGFVVTFDDGSRFESGDDGPATASMVA